MEGDELTPLPPLTYFALAGRLPKSLLTLIHLYFAPFRME
jgi:hypothetical protein